MLDYDLAKKIDEKTGSNKYLMDKLNFEDILDQLEISGIENPEKCIQLRPEIFLGEREYLGEHDSAYIKINNTQSKFSINIESLVTNDIRSFNNTQKTKIRTPYRNKRIFTAGQIVDRKYKQSINFEPKENEGVRFDSKDYESIITDKNLHFKTKFGLFDILDLDVETLEYDYRYNENKQGYETFSVNDIEEEMNHKSLKSDYTFVDYIKDKYIVYPYKVTETWQLAFEIDVDSKDIEKNESLSSPIEISYYLCVLKYSNKYLSEMLENKNVMFEIATLGDIHWQTTPKGMAGRGGLSKLGKIYCNGLMEQRTGIVSYSETVQLDDFSIEQFTNFVPKIYENPYTYDMNVDDDTQLHFHYPRVVSMLPVFD